MADLSKQLDNYRITTAEILYHLPDYPALLQSYVWQELDLAPRYPVLKKFLRFWEQNLEGKLHGVRIASQKLISPGDLRHYGNEFQLH